MERPSSEALKALHGRKLAIVTHNRADVDALSSAYAMSEFFSGCPICTSEDMSEGAKQLAARLGIETTQLANLDKSSIDGIVVVDTSAYTLVPEARGWKILCIIDHHRADGRDMKGEYEIIDEKSPSAAEIVAGILPTLSKEAAFALAVGVIADGARFKSARSGTFATLHRLMEICKAEYSELLSFAEPEPKEEAKIAMLSAMKRLEFVYAGGYIIATTEVGSNEADAASLISEAADVAFVAKWKDREKETRISSRARKSVRIPLNEVMGQVGKALGGAGGGHAKAAGASVKVHTEEALKKCIEEFTKAAERGK
ncbi:MAG TPA: DHHA1 domain-containing protein [Candidatus Bilamarchaeum sp.]|nr:DHHA1 domain-containing protein [Candidatus Bilamarchaeum sp.]